MRHTVRLESAEFEAWRGGVRPRMSVAAPFVRRCLSGSTVAPLHTPRIEPDLRIARIRLSDKDLTPSSRATPSAASEHHWS